MNRYLIVTLLVISFSLEAFTQNTTYIDSLLDVYNSNNSKQDFETLNKIQKYYIEYSPEKSIKYAKELYHLAQGTYDLPYMDLSSSILGEAYYYLDDIDNSIKYFTIYLEINKTQFDTVGMATAYNNLGIVSSAMNDYDKAIGYYIESINIKQALNDSIGISNSLNNIGVIYYKLGKYNEALSCYKKAYNIVKSFNNPYDYSTSYINMGEAYGKLKKYKLAEEYFAKSIVISDSLNDDYSLELIYECKYKMYKEKLEFSKALECHEKYIKYRKSRINEKTQKQIAELEIKYETIKKEKEIVFLNKQQQIHKITNRAFIIGLLFVVILLILVFIQNRKRKNTNKMLITRNKEIDNQKRKLAELNKTKDKFFSIISHDLKGAIGGFMSHTEFISDDFEILSDLDKHELIEDLNYSSKRLYLLLENLLQWSKSQTGDINVVPEKFYIKSLFVNIQNLYRMQLQNKRIIINNNIDEKIQVLADVNMLNTVVRNLLLNAIKFSYPESIITVDSRVKDNNLRIEISDRGVGISVKEIQKLFKLEYTQSTSGTDDEQGSGLGLILCKNFIELNKGKIWVESNKDVGSTFFFTIPLAN